MSDHDIIKGQRFSWLQLYIFFCKWTACHLKWWKWKSMSIISELRPTEKQKDSAWPGRRQKSLVIQLMISDCILGGITVLTVQKFILFILPIHTLTRLLIVKTYSGQQNFVNPVPLRRHYRVTKKMGIDYAAWRTRTGLNNYRQCRYYHPLPVQCRAARWGVGEVMNDTPLVLQSCIVVVSLSLILEYGIHSWRGSLKGRGGCDKMCCSKFGGGSVLSGEARGMVGVASGIHVLLQVCLVMLALLLMAGDVERNPGPTTKEGRNCTVMAAYSLYNFLCYQRVSRLLLCMDSKDTQYNYDNTKNLSKEGKLRILCNNVLFTVGRE